jgi:hypothetical protein
LPEAFGDDEGATEGAGPPPAAGAFSWPEADDEHSGNEPMMNIATATARNTT